MYTVEFEEVGKNDLQRLHTSRYIISKEMSTFALHVYKKALICEHSGSGCGKCFLNNDTSNPDSTAQPCGPSGLLDTRVTHS